MYISSSSVPKCEHTYFPRKVILQLQAGCIPKGICMGGDCLGIEFPRDTLLKGGPKLN